MWYKYLGQVNNREGSIIMNITIISLGTRGDVQPYVALGLGLKKAGHNVKLATHGEFSSFVVAYGLDFSPVEGNIQALLEGDAGKGMLGSGNNKFNFFRHFAVLVRPLMKNIMADSWKACQGADVILHSFFGLFAAKSIAERLGIPYYPAMIFPDTPTNVFAHNLFPPEIRLGPIYNRLTYSMVDWAFWHLFRSTFNDIRKEVLDLPPIKKNPLRQMRKERVPVLYGYSASILPRPKDWKDWIHVTGYWFLDSHNVWQPPEDLVDFLKSGTKPVYIGFGSMSNRDPEKTTGTVIKALQIAKQRGIIISGWGGLVKSSLPDEVYHIDSIPHDWLFPQMSVVVHHGGAGTIGAGLRAGCPTVVIPFFADQPFWGRCVYEAGAGPKPIPQHKLNPENLAHAISAAVCNKTMKQHAMAIGKRIRSENGVERAAQLVHRFVQEKKTG